MNIILLKSIIFVLIYNLQSVGTWNVALPTVNSYNPYCYFKECCNKDWISFNKHRLSLNITERVYGQPLVELAINAISSHFHPIYPSHKALTLSFHGMTGTGKNYVSKFIAESIYKKGTKSKFVHHFIGRTHFSETSKAEHYKRTLYEWIRGNVSDCPQRLFIFDEVDKMVPGVLNVIKPMVDYRDDVDGVDYSQSIFIFLSNTGASIINEHFHDLYISEGKRREDLVLSDFEGFVQKEAFSEKGWFSYLAGILLGSSRYGGFQGSDTIVSNLIDHYIPFLPLEQKHIIMCIRDEFKRRHVLEPEMKHIDEVLKIVEWGPDKSMLFAKTGCKRLGPKVGLLVDKHYSNYKFRTHYEL